MTRPTIELRTYQIEATPGIHRRLERFLALLHFAGRRGHSGIFAMPLDGDGPERLDVIHPPLTEYKDEAELIGGVGHDIEVAHNHSYGVKRTTSVKARYTAGRIAALYRNDDIVETLPRIPTEKEKTEDENLNDE